LVLSSETRLFDARKFSSVRHRVIQIVAEQLGVPEHEIVSDGSFLKGLAADSLDIVELIMEFDEEFG